MCGSVALGLNFVPEWIRGGEGLGVVRLIL